MTYDLAILGNPFNASAALADAPAVCTGIYKLMQRVIIMLFTDSTVPYNLGNGTQLLAELMGANYNPAGGDLKNQLDIATLNVMQAIQAADDGTGPDDERLASLSAAVSPGASPDTADIAVYVTSRAGSSYTVSIPLTQLSAENR